METPHPSQVVSDSDAWQVIPSIEISAGRTVSEAFGSHRHSVVININTAAAEEALHRMETPGTWPGTVHMNLKRSIYVPGFSFVGGTAERLPGGEDSKVAISAESCHDYFSSASFEEVLQVASLHELRHVVGFNNLKSGVIDRGWPVWQKLHEKMLSLSLGRSASQALLGTSRAFDPYRDQPREKEARAASHQFARIIPNIITISREPIPQQPGRLRRMFGF